MMYGYVAGAADQLHYQIDSIVLGVEADIQASGMGQSYSRNATDRRQHFEAGHKIPYLGTLRATPGLRLRLRLCDGLRNGRHRLRCL